MGAAEAGERYGFPGTVEGRARERDGQGEGVPSPFGRRGPGQHRRESASTNIRGNDDKTYQQPECTSYLKDVLRELGRTNLYGDLGLNDWRSTAMNAGKSLDTTLVMHYGKLESQQAMVTASTYRWPHGWGASSVCFILSLIFTHSLTHLSSNRWSQSVAASVLCANRTKVDGSGRQT